MILSKFACAFFSSLIPLSLPLAAQISISPVGPQGAQATSPSSPQIRLDVVVNTRSGQPVPNLAQQDFTILDNKSPRPITSFRALTPAQEPVSVILFIDAVNTPYELVADVRNQTEKYLKANEGVLAHPSAIAVLTDDGLQLPKAFSGNGMQLGDELEHQEIGLHKIVRSDEWNSGERLTICIKALHQLALFASRLPSRKIILWISPGFPLASGPGYSTLTPKAQQAIFGDVTYFSDQFRKNNITLYNVNPVGASQSVFDANYYQNFVKGIARPEDAQLADLSVQVLSIQSGGLALVSNNDVAGMIRRCLADTDSWYEISFDPPPAGKPNQYHQIDVKLDQPGLIARTRNGYYSNTMAPSSPR